MFQGKDIDIEILQTRDTFLLPLKEEQPKQVQKVKNNSHKQIKSQMRQVMKKF